MPVFERVAAIAEDVVFTVVLGKASDMVKEATGAAAAFTVTLTGDEVDVAKLLSPPYTAVMG